MTRFQGKSGHFDAITKNRVSLTGFRLNRVSLAAALHFQLNFAVLRPSDSLSSVRHLMWVRGTAESSFCQREAKSGDLSVSTRRIAAMAVAIDCHLCLLVVLLRPVARRPDVTPVVTVNDAAALELRLISPPRLTRPLLAPRASRLAAPPSVVTRTQSMKQAVPLPAEPVTHSTAPPPEPQSSNVSPQVVVPHQYTNSPAATGDGGFRERQVSR